MDFFKLTEHNGWEGETWHFFLPVEGNEAAVEYLIEVCLKFEKMGMGDLDLEFGEDLVKENEVDVLVKHSDSGYMDMYNKLEGKVDLEKLQHHIDNEDADTFYDNVLTYLGKGGISNYLIK